MLGIIRFYVNYYCGIFLNSDCALKNTIRAKYKKIHEKIDTTIIQKKKRRSLHIFLKHTKEIYVWMQGIEICNERRIRVRKKEYRRNKNDIQ